jgi:hypothetical protein
MPKNALHNGVSSCWIEIVKILCSEICELEAEVEQLQVELEKCFGELAVATCRLEEAQTQRDELCERLEYYSYRFAGSEDDDMD